MWVSTLCALAAVSADLLLNEVFYDPPGADGGYEFVELLNPTAAPLTLDGLSLRFVNGGDPEDWRELWRGQPGELLAPGAYLLLGEDGVPGRDRTLQLALQNGPDALWLLRDGDRIDALAWGDVSALAEGRPAPDVSGVSLGRVPDGVDVDDNQLDFRALDPPTPGAPNSLATEFALAGLELDPPWLERAGAQQLQLRFIAVGDAPEQRAELELSLDRQPLLARTLVGARGDTLAAEVDLHLDTGLHELAIELVASALLHESRKISVGLRELALNEILARPATNASEWVELRCATPSQCAGRRYFLADRSRALRSFTIPAGLDRQLLVVAADCGALGADAAEAICLEVEGAWPTLNDRPGTDGAADIVHVYDDEATLIDRVAFGGDGELQRDRSVEAVYHGGLRRWFLSPAAPTPGRVNATQSELPPGTGLRLQPNPWVGDVPLLHVFLDGVPPGARAEAELRDLRGRLVRTLGAAAAAGALRQWVWDGRDHAGRALAPGAYVVVARVATEGALRSHRALLALGVRR